MTFLERVATTVCAVVIVGSAGCRPGPTAGPVASMPPLGPGPRLDFAVPGTAALQPAVVASSPFVALAFGTRSGRGAVVYLATSSDNGATFSEPTPVSTGGSAGRAFSDISVDLVLPGGTRSGERPTLTVGWKTDAGDTVSREVRPWSRVLVEPARTPPPAPGAATVACEDGEVWLVDGPRGASRVSVNHGLQTEACGAAGAGAVVDVRRWVHAAWIAAGPGGALSRVLFASSSDGEWFGGAQTLAESDDAPAHVHLTTDPNDTVVTVWDHLVKGTRHVSLRQVVPAHHGPATLLPRTRVSDADGGEAPVVTPIAGGVLVAWQVPATGSVSVKRVGLDAMCSIEPAEPVAVPPVNAQRESR